MSHRDDNAVLLTEIYLPDKFLSSVTLKDVRRHSQASNLSIPQGRTHVTDRFRCYLGNW